MHSGRELPEKWHGDTDNHIVFFFTALLLFSEDKCEVKQTHFQNLKFSFNISTADLWCSWVPSDPGKTCVFVLYVVHILCTRICAFKSRIRLIMLLLLHCLSDYAKDTLHYLQYKMVFVFGVCKHACVYL